MKWKGFLGLRKIKLFSLLLILLASFPLYYNYSCINLNYYIECKLFNCPTSCGFLPLEFVIILFVSSLLACIIEYLVYKLKDKNKR